MKRGPKFKIHSSFALFSSAVFWSTSSFVHLAALYSIFSVLIRLELSVAGTFLFEDGSQNGFYRAVTSHGLGMVFLFIMPGLISGLGNFSVPHTYAGLDFATPRLNNLAFWISVFAINILVIAISYADGVSAGWTLYFPLTGIDFSSSNGMSLAIIFLHVLGLSSELGAITFLVSMQVARSAGILFTQFCLVSWAIAIVSFLLITTLPVLGAGITILFAERQGNMPALLGNFVDGGDPVAYQHLFWFFGHPEVYVIILPAFGLVSETIRQLGPGKTLSHPGMTLAMWSIAVVGFFVWAHHMFTTGMSDNSRLYFSAATAVIGVPTAIKIFAWGLGLSELKTRNLDYLLVVAFVTCFVFGGFTGLVLANGAVDFAYHDTYFVVGHFHYVLSIAAAIGAAIFVISLVGAVTQLGIQFSTGIIILLVGISAVNLLFAIMHIVGIEGHPRRVFLSPEIFIALNNFSNLAIIPLIFSFSAVAGMFSPAQTSITTTHRRFSYSCM